MRGSRGSTVGGGNVVKPPLTLQLEDAKTQGFSSYSNTYHFNYFFGDNELLARQVGLYGDGHPDEAWCLYRPQPGDIGGF